MSERLWTATLSAAQLEHWLIPPRTAAPFAIVERITAIDFPAPEEAITLANWPQGRLFGPRFELRWERQGEGYGAWLAGEEAAEEFVTELLHLTGMKADDAPCYLWGRDEMRIAHQLKYRALPEGKGRAQLIRREFRRADGTLVFYRLVRMQWEDDK
jgi:hypothetical protein